uniref:Importin N-terminal domain-containing protein n=1 Tax=Meloidogyne incognita TaxID=6306 RepID=A0A914LJG5_MELIC
MSELAQVLEKTFSGDPKDQQYALNLLQQAADGNFPEYVRQLAEVLSNVNNGPFIRKAAGLQLKNTLFSSGQTSFDQKKTRWLSTPSDMRDYVKKCAMMALDTETIRPSTAAQCVAAIACIELPLNQWADVIDQLSVNVTRPESSPMLREASLEALGYICQDARDLPYTGPILTAIVHGMREEETSNNIRMAATTALLNSLDFAKQSFETETERNIIMQVTCNATQSTETSIKVVALQCLVKIVSLYYRHMEPYMGRALFQITLQAMKDPVDEVSLQGIEFWSNVCDEELNLAAEAEEAVEQGTTPENVSKHYALGALPHILPTLTEKLAKQEADSEDDWNPAKSAGIAVMLLAQCCGDAIIDLILPFITQHFTNPDWHYREAAIMAFGSILEGPTKQKLLLLVEQAIQPLIVTLSDTHPAIKDTAAWAIGRVCDTCEGIVTREQTLSLLLPALSSALQDQPRVATNVCWAISSLVKAAYKVAVDQGGAVDEKGTPQTFILSPVFQNMVTELIKTSDRTDSNENKLRIAAYEALMELIKNSPTDCYPAVQQTTIIILGKLESLLSIEDALISSNERSQLRDLQSQLCATLQSVLHKIRCEDAPLISDSIMAGLLRIMGRCTGKESEAVVEEALMAITALIEVLKDGFQKYMPDFKPFLLAALENHDDAQIGIAAVGVVSDLCRAFETNISGYMDEIMERMLGILQDANAKKNVKTQVLNTFGDVALALNAQYSRYLDLNMKWLTEAISAAQITNADDFDQIDYVESLRESCCYAFSGIVQALNGSPESLQLIQRNIQPMLQLIVQISNSQPTTSENLYSSACALAGDLLHSFGVEFLPVVDTAEFGINTLVAKCRRSRTNKAKSIATWVTREIARVKRQAGNAAAAAGQS